MEQPKLKNGEKAVQVEIGRTVSGAPFLVLLTSLGRVLIADGVSSDVLNWHVAPIPEKETIQ